MSKSILSALAVVILGAVAGSSQTVKNAPQTAEQLRAAYGRLGA